MADLAAFADGLVHDLRNPLNVIRTNVYLLRQRLPAADGRTLRTVDRIDDQVTAAMQILEGAQAFYRSDRPLPEETGLAALARRVVNGTSPPEGVSLDLVETGPETILLVDPSLVEAALRALIRNAFEAMPDGGEACVRTETIGGRARLTVEDCGPGMPDDLLRRAPEPFFTTRKAHAGLGVTLAEKVARAHGGRLVLDSAPGEGTRAVLEFPFSGVSASA
jgi:signal transduction histidine kinase